MDDDRALFPIDGEKFELPSGTWQAKVLDIHHPEGVDRIHYVLEFTSLETPPKKPMKLTYWLSHAGLKMESLADLSESKQFLIEWLSKPSPGPEAHFFSTTHNGAGSS